MAEEKAVSRPSLWDQALKVVKGDSTSELVEQFTQEMTLVAEGLCEDQARLRKAVDGLIQQSEKERGRTAQDYEVLERQLDENARDTARRLEELSKRIAALEKQAAKKPEKHTLRSLFSGDLLGRVTLLTGMICLTVLVVTLVKLFV